MTPAPKISTCLWFNNEGEEAAGRMQQRMMSMRKLDIHALEQAFQGED